MPPVRQAWLKTTHVYEKLKKYEMSIPTAITSSSTTTCLIREEIFPFAISLKSSSFIILIDWRFVEVGFDFAARCKGDKDWWSVEAKMTANPTSVQ
jgi:hypothetical protein